MDEAELNLSGIVNPSEAITIGQLTGVKLIVTGSVFQIDNTIYVVAKIIGTETSRVVGASVMGVVGDGLDGLSNRLGEEIIRSIKKRSMTLLDLLVVQLSQREGLAVLERQEIAKQITSASEQIVGRLGRIQNASKRYRVFPGSDRDLAAAVFRLHGWP